MVWRAHFDGNLPFGGGCVAAIGNFDGVHAGHRAVVDAARAEAGRRGVPCVALTFEPHPRDVLRPAMPVKRLSTPAEKVRLLGEAGVAGVAVLDFTLEVAGWRAEDFIRRVLVGWLRAEVVCVGEGFRFGHKAGGTVETLRADGRFEVVAVPLVTDGEGRVVSSSLLREGR